MVVAWLGALFLILAAIFAFMRSIQGDELDFGWVAVGCLIIAVWLLPALLTLTVPIH